MAARRTADALERYRKKRDFSKTSEPPGTGQAAGERLFVVQKHAARRMHYDLRMQFGGALRSWAVPQGPSLDPKIRRLAVRVEDHPLEYYDFEGPIPKGQYGGGAMIVWDRGTWVPMGDAEADYQKGTIKFRLSGEKLGGGWTLVRIKNDEQRGDNWLLIKERDPSARPEAEGNILDEAPESVISGRGVEDISLDEPARPVAEAPKPRPVRVAKLAGAKRADLPASLRPQLASPSASIPDGDDWLHEIKLDGYRTIARIEDGAVRLFTRQGHDWTDRYGSLARAFVKIPCRQAMIDGEIVVQDEAGISHFSSLQDALAEGRTHELTFFAFDLLHLDGYDLTEVRLHARKQALEGLLAPLVAPTSPLQLSGHIQGHGPDFLAQASRMGLEGVISKRADSRYRPGRGKSWLKTKCLYSDEFQVVGFAESAAAGGLGALLLAEAHDDGSLRYVGRVGTGYSAGEADRLLTRLQALRQDAPAVALPAAERRKAIWVRPALQVEVHYGSRTADGILRHAVYKGLRADKAAPDTGSAPNTPRRRWVTDEDLASVWVTNPDRTMFGAGGPSKLELALYYAQVGDWILPELSLRPVSLVRCPTGKAADCFFQRHALSGMPEAIRRMPLREEGSKERADYLYVENARGLLALAQFGAVEFHSWGCRVDKPERPDRMVFDLDPDEGLPWRQVVDAAFEVRHGLEDLGFTPFIKTTGGKGLHVVVALARRQSWPEVRAFAETFAVHMARRLPRLFTSNMAKSSRRGRIFLDYLRNARSATAVAAYSLRARPGVPASTPVSWDELVEIDDPADLNYATVPERLTEVEDPWIEIAQSARPLTKEMERKLQAGR